jgi:hypothetical protein
MPKTSWGSIQRGLAGPPEEAVTEPTTAEDIRELLTRIEGMLLDVSASLGHVRAALRELATLKDAPTK